jgi:hypothetical protein
MKHPDKSATIKNPNLLDPNNVEDLRKSKSVSRYSRNPTHSVSSNSELSNEAEKVYDEDGLNLPTSNNPTPEKIIVIKAEEDNNDNLRYGEEVNHGRNYKYDEFERTEKREEEKIQINAHSEMSPNSTITEDSLFPLRKNYNDYGNKVVLKRKDVSQNYQTTEEKKHALKPETEKDMKALKNVTRVPPSQIQSSSAVSKPADF